MKSNSVSVWFPVLALVALFGCGDEGNDGAGSSVTLTAPTIVGPNSTSPIADNQPVLTVNNASASNGSTPTYTFQVASDSGFGNIAAQASGIAQGASQTTWEVTQPLANGSYFWRARADVSGVAGPFSGAAQLAIFGVGGPGETIVLQDDLTTAPRSRSSVEAERSPRAAGASTITTTSCGTKWIPSRTATCSGRTSVSRPRASATAG